MIEAPVDGAGLVHDRRRSPDLVRVGVTMSGSAWAKSRSPPASRGFFLADQLRLDVDGEGCTSFFAQAASPGQPAGHLLLGDLP
jgi:hypothetical protein